MLIFLDIDGVMVPAKGWKSPELLSDGFPAFSSKAVSVLQHLVTDDATILLTTSHKSAYTIDEWKKIFTMRGIAIEKIGRLDENVSNRGRRDELLAWFSINKVHEAFIIIDDDKSLNALPPALKEHLILTSPMVGLNDEHLATAKAILQQGLQAA